LSKFEKALEAAWNHLVDWVTEKKFVPRNEEDIQCFLYHALVLQFGTATCIRAKATVGKPAKLRFEAGKLQVGDMHFPDLALGDRAEDPDVVVEIKYRPHARSSFYARCKSDIAKLKRLHDGRIHYFILFDANPEFVFLDEHQRKELSDSCSENGRLLYYPVALNTSPLKARAREVVQKMRQDGVDFVARGQAGAKKAVLGQPKKAV
jgi:hypothetical protein